MNLTATFPLLVGDIGGTNARFGWKSHASADLTDIKVIECNNYATIEDAICAYLEKANKSLPKACAIGIANPVTGDHVQMTNHHWSFSIEALKKNLGVNQLKLINDFAALALAIPAIPKSHLVQILSGIAAPKTPIALIGAGTGLGVSGLIPHSHDDQWIPLAGEGGHATLAAQTRCEHQVIELLGDRYGHVSAERVLSGQGLVDLYGALGKIHKSPCKDLSSAAEVTNLALQQQDALAIEALGMFAGWLGSVAGDLVLTLGARGGLYLGGGIIPRWLGWFENSSFKSRFTAKGRFTTYMQEIPVWVINAPESPALWGVARSI